MGTKLPRDLMEILMDGGVPEQIPYHTSMPESFYERMEKDAGKPLSEAYRFDWGFREFLPRMLGRQPLDLPWINEQDKEKEDDLLRQRFARYLPKQHSNGLRVSEYGIISVPGSMHHLRHLVPSLGNATSIQELEEFPWPDLTEDWRWTQLETDIRKAKQEDYYLVGNLYYIYETAWYLRGQEQLMIDFYENPEFAGALFDKIADIQSMSRSGSRSSVLTA